MGEIFTHRLRVRYSECDQQGVVFNGHYLFMYDVALTELWRAAVGDYSEMVAQGYDLVVVEARIRYREGARFDELLDVRMPVARLGRTSMVVRPEFRVGERLIAEGRWRTCSSTRRPRPSGRSRRTSVRRCARTWRWRADAERDRRPALRQAQVRFYDDVLTWNQGSA
ncbi:acyl-CoA thioesterase [Actinomadura yumaensis]|uniref:acyl-CoA thioesterase n=1 Tax=Actinomadura yumaensis TaxID=111807 RepID=UPI003605D87B